MNGHHDDRSIGSSPGTTNLKPIGAGAALVHRAPPTEASPCRQHEGKRALASRILRHGHQKCAFLCRWRGSLN